MTEDQEWTRRHIAAFRFHRGHSMCTVDGCTGSQPLMWVPTEREVWAERQPRGRSIDLPLATLHVGMTRPDGTTPMHIDWTRQ